MAIVDAAAKHYQDYRNQAELEAVFTAAEHIVKTIDTQGYGFTNHKKFLYWVAKPSNETHGVDTDWDDVTQNILILEFLHQICEISPLVTDEASYDLTGKPIDYEETFGAETWALRTMKWLDPTRLAFQLQPVAQVKIEQFEFDHVEHYWYGYGDTHPSKNGFADIQAWQHWILT